MQTLYVIYDESCGFCVRCRRWLANQTQLVTLAFVAASAPEVNRRFPNLRRSPPGAELIAVSAAGGVYRGTDALLMCLWALKEYRPWATRLARPALKPLVRRAFELFSSHRHAVSRLLGLHETERELELAITEHTRNAAHNPATTPHNPVTGGDT